jgi:hypothetical protein
MLLAASLVAGCGSGSETSSSTTVTTAAPAVSATATADMRTKLNLLLSDHLVLAAKATGAALGARTDEFNAYGALLAKNGTELGSLIGSVYGADSESKFNSIWTAHNGFFVEYTTGVAKADKAVQDKAVSDLTTVYVPQFTDFVVGATGLDKAAVSDLVSAHVSETKAVVDAQGAKNWSLAAKDQEAAYSHMRTIGDPLAAAIAGKNSSKFPIDTTTGATDLRQTVNLALQDHLYLATQATAAALGGRTDEFQAYGSALDANGKAIGAQLGTLYGPAAEGQFNGIWSAHNGFFVDYTTGLAKGDKAVQDKAVADLTGTYVPQFTDFVVGATGLDRLTVQTLVTDHVTQTKGVVDAQAAKNWTLAANNDRAAAQHMQMIGDPLSSAIAKKFPEKLDSTTTTAAH